MALRSSCKRPRRNVGLRGSEPEACRGRKGSSADRWKGCVGGPGRLLAYGWLGLHSPAIEKRNMDRVDGRRMVGRKKHGNGLNESDIEVWLMWGNKGGMETYLCANVVVVVG